MKFVGHRGPEISGDEEVDPIWKSSNKRDRRRSGTEEFTKLSITRSFFELDTPYFAQEFVWTSQTKYKCKKSTKVLITEPFFKLQTSDLA